MRNNCGVPLSVWKELLLPGAVVITLAAPVAVAQSPPAAAVPNPAFEVASVKQNKSGSPQRGMGFQPGGRFRATNMTLRGVVAAAYGTPEPLPLFRVLEGPNWIDSDRFDIEAIAGSEFVETQSRPGWTVRGELMLRTLLADRFKLIARQETRELPAYALVMARSDGRLGQQLRRSLRTDCQAPAPTPCGGFGFTPQNRLSASDLTLDQFARYIMLNAVDRPVVNRTGLTGNFSLDIDYTRSIAPSVSPAGANDQSVDSGTSIFTALQEQLGLKLQPITVPLDVVIIDRVEQPTEN